MIFLGRCLTTPDKIKSKPGDFLGEFFFRLNSTSLGWKALGREYIGRGEIRKLLTSWILVGEIIL